MRHVITSMLCLVLACASAKAGSCTSGPPNLVANCGFESGDFLDWTLSGHDSAPGFEGIDYGVDSVDAHTGAYGAYLGGFGGVLDLSQFLTTTAGANYTVSFWLEQSPAPTSSYLNSFSLSLGPDILVNLNQVPNGTFTQYSFSAAATATLTPLTFGFRDDLGFFSIDDISVTPTAAVPEPAVFFLGLLGLAALGIMSTCQTQRQ